MDLSPFIVTVFCLVDDWLEGRKLRQRGPAPKLSDSEVLTMEIVGEYLSSVTKWTKEGEFPKLRARTSRRQPRRAGADRSGDIALAWPAQCASNPEYCN